MKKTITSEILVAYYQCPRKAYLLLCNKNIGKSNEYIKLLKKEKSKIQLKYLRNIQNSDPDVKFYDIKYLKTLLSKINQKQGHAVSHFS